MVDSRIFSKKYTKSKYCFVKGEGCALSSSLVETEGKEEMNYN